MNFICIMSVFVASISALVMTSLVAVASPSSSGSWGPSIQLRAPKETYATYPTPYHRDEPAADGWWIAPIHANLLPSGDVLMTGWARVKERECPTHSGRQWPASFVLSFEHDSLGPAGTRGSSYSIANIDEKPELRGGVSPRDPVDVLYCSGHVPLADGRVLFTGGARYVNLEMGGHDPHHQPTEFEDEYGLDYARVFDPKTRSFTRVPNPFPDGPDLNEVASIASAHPSSQQPKARDWLGIYEKGMMWYPTNLRLPDGRVLVAGGFARQSGPFDPQFVNRSLSIFDPKASADPWEIWVRHRSLNSAASNGASVSSAASSESLEQVGPDPIETLNLSGFDYVHLFLLPRPVFYGGHPYHVAVFGGLNETYGLLTLDREVPVEKRLIVPPSGSGLYAGPKRPAGRDGRPVGGSDTTGLVLPTGQIVMIGGGSTGLEGGQRIDVYDPYTNRWKKPLNTGISRIRAASILLPNGEVLILNGEESYTPNSNIGDRRRPLLYDPVHHRVRVLDPWTNDARDRGYHNFALLLQDGRVLLGGGRELVRNPETGLEDHRIGCERPDVRVYLPPYLFKGERPRWLRAQRGGGEAKPIRMKLGGLPVMVEISEVPLRSSVRGGVVMMALGAQTHHFDQNQRMVPLKYERKGRMVRIFPPKSGLEAPVGFYNLYLVSEKGVPSQGLSVQLVDGRE